MFSNAHHSKAADKVPFNLIMSNLLQIKYGMYFNCIQTQGVQTCITAIAVYRN